MFTKCCVLLQAIIDKNISIAQALKRKEEDYLQQIEQLKLELNNLNSKIEDLKLEKEDKIGEKDEILMKKDEELQVWEQKYSDEKKKWNKQVNTKFTLQFVSNQYLQ